MPPESTYVAFFNTYVARENSLKFEVRSAEVKLRACPNKIVQAGMHDERSAFDVRFGRCILWGSY